MACAWFYRNLFLKDIAKTILLIIWPLFSSFTLFGIAVYGALYIFDYKSIILGIGGIGVGAIPLFLNKLNRGPSLKAEVPE